MVGEVFYPPENRKSSVVQGEAWTQKDQVLPKVIKTLKNYQQLPERLGSVGIENL